MQVSQDLPNASYQIVQLPPVGATRAGCAAGLSLFGGVPLSEALAANRPP